LVVDTYTAGDKYKIMLSISHAHRVIVAFILVAVLYSTLRTASKTSNTTPRHRQLLSLSQFTDPKSVTLRSDAPLQQTTQFAIPNEFIADYDIYTHANQPVDIPPTMTSYNIENCFHAVNAFRYTIFFFVYEAKSDSFVVIHNIKGCNFGCNRIHRVASVISQALRINTPERFHGEKSDDLILMISTGDNRFGAGPFG